MAKKKAETKSPKKKKASKPSSAVGNSKRVKKQTESKPKEVFKSEGSKPVTFSIRNEAELSKTLLEVLRTAPMFPATLPHGPMPARREKQQCVELEVQDEKRGYLLPLHNYPRGQHMIAVLIPIANTQDALPWLSLNKQGDYLASIKPSDFTAEYEVSTGYMADALGMSARNLQLLANKNPTIKIARGRYNLVETFKAYLKTIIDEYKGRGGSEFSLARTREKEAAAKLKELELAEKRGQLTLTAEVGRIAHQMGLSYKRALDNLPTRITNKSVRKELKKEIKDILDGLGLLNKAK